MCCLWNGGHFASDSMDLKPMTNKQHYINVVILVGENFALLRPASLSSGYSGLEASKAVDGNKATFSHTHANDLRPWWKVHLAYPIWVQHVEIVNTDDNGKQSRIYHVE